MSDQIKGTIHMVSSSVIFSLMAVAVKYAHVSFNISAWKSAEFRFLVCIAAILLLSLSRKYPLKFVNLRWLTSRGLFGGVAVCIFFYSMNRIGMAKATILTYTYPIWAAMLSPILFKKRISGGLWISIIAAFIGLCLIIIPSSGISSFSVADLIALAGGLFSGWAILSLKKLHETDSSRAILFSQCFFGIIIAAVPAHSYGYTFPVAAWILLLCVGIFAFLAQLQMTHAYRFIGATEGSLLSMLTPVFSLLLGFVVFSEKLSRQGLAGCLVVLISCSYAAISETKLIGATSDMPL